MRDQGDPLRISGRLQRGQSWWDCLPGRVRSLSKYTPSSKPNFVSLEEFVDAMVIVEGLKKAGQELTSEELIRGMESVHDLDIGLGTELKLDLFSKRPQGIRSPNSNGDSRWPRGAVTDWLVVAPH